MRRSCAGGWKQQRKKLAGCARSCRQHRIRLQRCPYLGLSRVWNCWPDGVFCSSGRVDLHSAGLYQNCAGSVGLDKLVHYYIPFLVLILMQAERQHASALATAQGEAQAAQQQRAGLNDVLTAAQDRLQQLQVGAYGLLFADTVDG